MDILRQARSHLSQDLQLKALIDRVELDYQWRPEQQGDVYFRLLRAISGQQVSVKAADAIHQRFLNLFEDQYPHAQQVLEMDAATLRSAGLSRQKVAYVQNVAAYFTEQNLLNQNWTNWENEAIIKKLTEIKGIGRWTVEVVLMFCLNRGNIFPIDDLGIQLTMQRLYNLESDKRQLKKSMKEIANNWQPYRTLACYYLWSWKHRW